MAAASPVYDELADALRQYAVANFSGVLQVDGRPGGTIYFSSGRISACETSGAPSLEVVLLRSRQIAEADWDAAFTAAAVGERQITAELVGRELISAGELEALLRIALADAMFALLSGQVNGWLEAPQADCMLPLTPSAQSGWLIAEATRRGQVLAAFPGPALSAQDRITAAPGAGRSGYRLGPDQDAILTLADGRRTARDVAFALGRGLYETMLELARMRAGNVVVITPHGKESLPPGLPVSAAPDDGADDRTVTGLPRRRKDRAAAAPRAGDTGRRNLTAIRMLWPRSEGNTTQ
jgi:Domain of unknown function (DUF4388)